MEQIRENLRSGQIADVLAAFPACQFKQRFTRCSAPLRAQTEFTAWQLARRGLCRKHASTVEADSVEERIAAADFPE